MPEIFLCQKCHKRVDLKADEYVVTNRATARSRSQWVYSHATCVEGLGPLSNVSEADMQRMRQTLLEVEAAEMNDEALRRLGLQRINGDPR